MIRTFFALTFAALVAATLAPAVLKAALNLSATLAQAEDLRGM